MTEYKFSSEWIKSLETIEYWEHYWQQQKLIFGRINKDEKIAEVGIGSKFTHNYLKSKGFDIVSFDIDKDKYPERVLNIVDIEDSHIDFSVLLGFNVFEHIPYNEFLAVMKRMQKNGVEKIFIGLPPNHRVLLDLTIKIPKFKKRNIFIAIPSRKKLLAKNHFWGLGYSGYNVKRVKLDLKKIGYECREFFNYKLETYFYFHLLD